MQQMPQPNRTGSWYFVRGIVRFIEEQPTPGQSECSSLKTGRLRSWPATPTKPSLRLFSVGDINFDEVHFT